MIFPGWMTHQNNLARQAGISVTNPADATNFPPNALAQLPVSKTCRLYNRASNVISLSLPRAIDADFIALVGHNLSATATITVNAGATFGAATYSAAMTWRRRTAFLHIAAGAETYAFWNLTIEDDANEHGFIEAGYIALGELVVPNFGYQDEWPYTTAPVQIVNLSPSGTPDIRTLAERERVLLSFSGRSNAEVNTLRALFISQAGRETPLFIVPDTSVNEGFFGRFAQEDGFTAIRTNLNDRAAEIELVEDPAGISLETALPQIRTGEALPSGATFTRASTAWYKNQDLELVSAAVDTLRDPHYLASGKFGILLEPERTNAWTYSEDLSPGIYVKVRASISTDAADEPKATPGTVADKLVEDATASNSHYIQRNLATATDDTIQAISFFAKAAERNWVRIDVVDKSGTVNYRYLDLSDGTSGSGSGLEQGTNLEVENYTDGWLRILIYIDISNGGTTPVFRIRLADSDGGQSYSGDGASGIYLWGFQHEVDENFPSSIVSTDSGTATRDEDQLTLPTWAAAPEPFSVYFQFVDIGAFNRGANTGYLIFVGDSATLSQDPRFLIRGNTSGGNQGYYVLFDAGAGASQITKVSADFAFGSVTEIVGKITNDVAARVMFKIANGTQGSSSGTALGASALAAAGDWNEQVILINKNPSSTSGGNLGLVKAIIFRRNGADDVNDSLDFFRAETGA